MNTNLNDDDVSETYSQDLEPREGTWKGIVLSLLVIGMVFGGICLSAFYIQPSKQI